MASFWCFQDGEKRIEEPERADGCCPVRFEEAFPFLLETKHIISFVGAGGKTTLMYAMARFCAELGRKVLVTTTTHIRKPDKGQYARELSDVFALWENGKYAVVGEETTDNKLSCLQIDRDSTWQTVWEQADIILIEADGSKRLPCKAPAGHEPVIPNTCDIVINVVGLCAVGRMIKDCCCRVEEVTKVLEVNKEHVLNEEDISELLSSEVAGRKDVGDRQYYMVLNQCDTPAVSRMAGRIVEYIPQKYRQFCVASYFDETEREY